MIRVQRFRAVFFSVKKRKTRSVGDFGKKNCVVGRFVLIFNFSKVTWQQFKELDKLILNVGSGPFALHMIRGEH